MNRLSICLASCLLVACTQDSGVAVHNNAPEVSFVLPADNSWAYAGVAMEFMATITDDITANEDLTTSWTSTIDGYLSGTESVDGEALSMVIDEGLSVGEHVITLQIVDGSGETAEDVVTVEMVQNSAPSASFIKPQENDVFAHGDLVEVLAYFQDEEDMENLDLLEVVWESGDLDSSEWPTHGDSQGKVRLSLYDLPVGNYSLGYEVYDLAGDFSNTAVSFSVE